MIRFSSVLVLLGVFQTAFAQAPVAPAKTNPLQDSVRKYQSAGKIQKAIPFAEAWLAKTEADSGATSAPATNAMNSLGVLYMRTGQMEKSESALLKALDIQTKTYGENHLRVAITQHNLGGLYKEMGDLEKSIHHLTIALKIRKEQLGENNIEVASTINSIGVVNLNLGRYKEAEAMYKSALAIRIKVKGEESEETGDSYNNLGVLFWQSGDLPKAEEHHEKALAIREKVFGKEHLAVAQSLNNIGLVYIFMGNLSRAESFLIRSLDIKRKIQGDSNLEIAAAYNNLGNLTKNMGRYDEAARYGQMSLAISEKILGPDHHDVGASCNNLGELHYSLGNYFLAEKYHQRAARIWTNAYGPGYIEVGGSYMNLANVYGDRRQWKKSDEYSNKGIAVYKALLGDMHPDLEKPYYNKAINMKQRGNLASAEEYFHRSNSIYLKQVRDFFPSFSDQEKEDFYGRFKVNSDEYQAFAALRYSTNPGIAGHLYNHQLSTKALLLSSAAKWKHRIKNSQDSSLIKKYGEWESLQTQLAELLQSTDSTERLDIGPIQQQAEKLGKQLSLQSESFARLNDKRQVTWKTVQKSLKANEAAVEIIRIRKKGIQRMVTDTSDLAGPTYKIEGLIDSAQYVALILKPGNQMPELIWMPDGTGMEGKNLRLYQNSITLKIEDRKSFGAYWQKIAAKLGKATRIYVSPDGVYHHINLNTLKNPKTGRYLLEEKDIRMVTVTKDIVSRELSDGTNKMAELVGFPDYYAAGNQSSVPSGIRTSPRMSYGLLLDSTEVLPELPATKEEVDKIAGIFKTNGWQVQNYTGNSALEENIKEASKPAVLHIATHGFFQPDSTPGSNPLLRSGLMLAGAGTTLKGAGQKDKEDGILTAYEAMNLNLDNTDLVVLSACETGLGEIKNGEGVYGLQRAFKVAGAKTLIMSLWKVNDEATQELMVRFYKNWLSPAKGGVNSTAGGLRSAFLAAQKELKAKYPDPYYWGAFVMVGE